jgi:hypothetical protein
MADEPEYRDNPREETEELAQEGRDSLKACRTWKAIWEPEVRECYFLAAPHRQRIVISTTAPPQRPIKDEGDLNTDLAFELCGDFATEVTNTYLPEALNWCERGRGERTSENAWNQVKDRVKAADTAIHLAIRASNFYAEWAKVSDPDLSIGTVAMWSHRPRPGGPVEWLAVPLRELEINMGPDGNVDDRWVIRKTRNKYVRRILADDDIWAKVPEAIKKIIAEKPGDGAEVNWGFWRLWDEVGDVVWQHVIYIKNELVHACKLRGEGCCPLLVMRWNPNADWPFGYGPLMQYRPSLRQVDELEYMRMEHTDLASRPPIGYPDDSFTNIEQGLEPGMAYPIRPGTGNDIKPIYVAPPQDAAKYTFDDKAQRLRKGFYVDFPVQTGDTPPTLGQWLDEMARAQRRIGRPGLPFWREGPAQIFIRTMYLMEKAGSVEKITIDGVAVALMPYNPTQRAAEQQDIAMLVHALQICAQFFPEEFKVQIDGAETMKRLLEKMRVMAMVKFRDQAHIAAAVEQIQKLTGGQAPGAQGAGQISGQQAA